MKKKLRYLFLAMMAMICGNIYAAWEKATSIAVNDVIIIAVDNGTVTKELSGIKNGNAPIGDVADYSGTPAGVFPLTVVAGSQEGSFAFKNGNKYLSWSTGNSLTVSEEVNDNSSWTVTFNDGVPTINNVQTTTRDLSYNAGSPRFACYNNTNQTRVTIWKQTAGGSGDTKTATTIKFADGYTTQIAQGPDGMFPEIGSVVDLPTATVMAGDAAVEGANVDWSIELKSWKEKGEGEKPVIANGKISFEGYGSVVVKASFAGNDKYEPSSKSYDLTVHNSYGLLKEMVKDIADPKFEKNDEADKDGKPVFYFFRNIDADGFPSVTSTVTYVNGKYIYLTDDEGNNLLFFGTNSQNLKQGDKISGNVSDTNLGGFWGLLKRYNKLPEFAFTTMNVKVESEGNPVTPATITIDELVDNINNYVKIENAEFVSADKKNLVFKVDDKEFAVYNQFNMNVDALEASAKYTLEGMGSVFYNSKSATGIYQLHLISFDKTSEPTGINSAKVAKTATTIFNIAGQTLSVPQKGLNIIDGKKVLVR